MTFRQNFNINVKITAVGTLCGPWTEPVDGMTGPHAGGLAIRPIVARARDGLRKGSRAGRRTHGELTYMLLDSVHGDLTDCPGESCGRGLGGARYDALVLRSRSPRPPGRRAQDRIVFNVYEGLEMHGERG
jgi:hypothetical protein